MGFTFGPSWFYGIDSVFEIVAMFITLFIAVYSIRIYFLSKLKKFLYFTLAFLFLSASYFIRAIADYVVYSSLTAHIPNLMLTVQTIAPLPAIYSFVYLIYVFLTFAGFMILVAIFMRIRKVQTVSLLFALVLVLALFSQSRFLAFHLTMIILLLYIVVHLLHNYIKKGTISAFFVLLSMISLLIGHVFFYLSSFDRLFYAVGHVLQLSGFLLLLINMFLVLRRK